MPTNNNTIMEAILAYFQENHQSQDNDMFTWDWSLAIEVLESGAGFYIGQRQGYSPYSRLSEEYFATREAAQLALDTADFTPRLSV